MSDNNSFFYDNNDNNGNSSTGANIPGEEDFAYKAVIEYKSRGWSVASFILSLLSVVCCCAWYVMIILAVLGIVFAIISRKNLGYFDGLAIAGLVLGIIGFVFTMFFAVFELSGISAQFLEEYEKALDEILGDTNNSI